MISVLRLFCRLLVYKTLKNQNIVLIYKYILMSRLVFDYSETETSTIHQLKDKHENFSPHTNKNECSH